MFACLRACMRLHARAIISVCSFIVYMSGSQDTHELREASIVFKGMYMYKHIDTCIHVYVHMAFTSVAHHAMPILTYRSCTQAVRGCSGTSRVCVCLCVCVWHVRMPACVHAFACARLLLCACLHACVHVCMRAHVRAYVHACDPFILSLFQLFIPSSDHPVTSAPFHHFTLSAYHMFTLSLCKDFI